MNRKEKTELKQKNRKYIREHWNDPVEQVAQHLGITRDNVYYIKHKMKHEPKKHYFHHSDGECPITGLTFY
jgi:hypothetical protein